jgi:hypothetical protein
MKRKWKSLDEQVSALRKEPAFRDLVNILKGQTPEQLDRFSEHCEYAEREERYAEKTEPDTEEGTAKGT